MAVLDRQPDDQPDVLEKARGVLSRFRKYHETKSSVRAGQPLWELSPSDLSARGMLGPWEFNLMESSFAALPALAAAKLLRLLFTERPEVVQARESLSPVLRLTQDNFQYLVALVTPFALFALVLITARAGLRSADSNPERRRRSRRAYLYLDGGYGLLPQVLVSLGLAGNIAVLERSVPFDVVFVVAFTILLYTGSFWNIYIVGRKIPKLLFAANGYSPDPPRLFSFKRGPNSGPWTRYSLTIIFLGPLIVWPIFGLAWGFAYSGAWLVIQLRALLG